jgi:hypothetical protein
MMGYTPWSIVAEAVSEKPWMSYPSDPWMALELYAAVGQEYVGFFCALAL